MTTVNVLDMACAAVASAPGTGTITLGATEPGGFLSWSDAGAVNGQTYGYYIQDGNNRESGFGVYSSSGPTLTRNVTSASVNGVAQGTPINATANAVVSSSVSAATIENISSTLSATITSDVATLQAEINAIHGYITTTVYTSSQTITIPGTIGRIRLVGGGGGANTSNAPVAAGAGGYLEKLLSGLTIGNTVTLTIGAGGTSAPTSGGNSTLVSGTQTITTLTAHGGNTSGAGGTATNGDINVTGGDGVQAFYTVCGSPVVNFAQGGVTPLAMSVAISGSAAGIAGSGYGGGAAAVSTGGGASASGAAGVCIIDWYI